MPDDRIPIDSMCDYIESECDPAPYGTALRRPQQWFPKPCVRSVYQKRYEQERGIGAQNPSAEICRGLKESACTVVCCDPCGLACREPCEVV